MSTREIVVVGASAGGIEALKAVARGLPADFPAAVCVVTHVSPHFPSTLPDILTRAGPLPAAHAHDGEAVRPGRIYVAPPDHHLLVQDGHVRLSRGPKENRTRPAVNPLFRTAAAAYGARVVGVVLSGALDDGTAGLRAVEARGGVTVVQDPGDALFPSMPRSALRYVKGSHVAPAAQMGALLARLVREPLPAGAGPGDPAEADAATREAHVHGPVEGQEPGTASGFACPECEGALWEMGDEAFPEFRCRIGHRFSAEALLAERAENTERSLYHILLTLEEQAALAARFAERPWECGGDPARAGHYAREAEAAREQARVVRALVERGLPSAPDVE